MVAQEYIFEVSDILSAPYGDGTYGDGVYGGVDNGVYQFQLHLKNQKCQSFRVVIEDMFDNSVVSAGEGGKISGITVEVGTKTGLNKVNPTKTA